MKKKKNTGSYVRFEQVEFEIPLTCLSEDMKKAIE